MDRDRMYALVQSSPEIVGRHDREAWLGLFSSTAVVEDPVGAGPNRKNQDWRGGHDGLGRFYNVFISANDIRFTVHQDIITDDEVVRDVSIRTILPNGAVSEVQAYLLYRCREENGEIKIEHLQAFWDFTGNAVKLITGNGLKGILASNIQFGNMIKIQGLKRVAQYCGAMYRGIFKRGFIAVNDFVGALNAKDVRRLSALFEPAAAIEFPAGKRYAVTEFLQDDMRDMRLEVTGLRSSGWYTSCVFDAYSGPLHYHGVAFFRFDSQTKKIKNARFFFQT